MKTKTAPVAFVLAMVGVFSYGTLAVGQPLSPPQPSPTPVVEQAEKHDVSPALRDIPVILPAAPPVFREIPRQPLPRRGPKPGFLDPVIQGSPGTGTMPSTLKNFEGLSNADQSSVSGFVVWPPDTNGDVGPTHYVQWVNLAFAIYKKDGTKLYGPAAGNTLWTGFGGACETSNDGDPIVLYDHLADRWLLSQFALPNFPSGPFYQCIAVSQAPDPTGAYYRYAFKISQKKLNDYPKFGVWPDGYYMAVNQFSCSMLFCSWAGQGVAAFERAKMLSGDPTANMVYFDLYSVNPNLGGMLPSDLDGPAPPAPRPPNYFVEVDDNAWGYSPDQLQIWAFSPNWSSPSASTFTFQTALPTASFDSNMCGYSVTCIPQPGTKSKLDALSDRLMYRLQYRDFGTYASLVTNHTVDVDGLDHAGIRWYELRNSGSGWSIHQQGTYAPDADHRWMGSLAMDGAGNIALGFSVSSSITYPSIRYTGRLAGDPVGQMTQGEATVIGGMGSQTGSGRWGDYSMLGVDPTDGCTFWYTQEYYPETSSTGWHTRVASFKFSSCGVAASGADLAIAMADAPDPVSAGATLTYTLTVSNAGPETATAVSVTDTLPAGVTFVSASGTGWTCSGTGPVTCTLATLAVGTASPITITVTAPTAGGTITNTATVSSATVDPNPNNNTATATTTVQAAASPSVTVLRPNGGETWKISTNKTIQWTSSGVSGNVEIALSRDGGVNYSEVLFASTPNDGSQTWYVTGPATSTARIRVCTAGSSPVCDTSDGNFAIK